jgi:hypothetical protein
MLNALTPREEVTVTDNGKTVYDYNFKIYADTDIVAYATAADAEPNDSTDLVIISAVTGVGEADGGTITIPAMDVGTLLTIVSNIPTDRDVSYVTNGDFVPPTVNDDFDKTLSIVKQIDATRRGLKFADSAQGVDDVTMPALDADKFLRVNSTADGIIYTEFPTTVGSVTSVSGHPSVVGGTVSDPIITALVDMVGDRVSQLSSESAIIETSIIMAEENGNSAKNIYEVEAIGEFRSMPGSATRLDGVMCVFDVGASHENDSSATLKLVDGPVSTYPIVTMAGSPLVGGEIVGTIFCVFDNNAAGRWKLIYATEVPFVPNDYIETAMVQDDAIATPKIPDQAITLDKLDASATEANNVNLRVAKAWANYNMATTTLNDNFGVDSASLPATGKASFVLDSAMNGTSFIVVASAFLLAESGVICSVNITSTTTFDVYVVNNGGQARDATELHVLVYGILA